MTRSLLVLAIGLIVTLVLVLAAFYLILSHLA